MSRNTYTVSTTNPADKTLYGILITEHDGTTGWIVGNNGDGLFYENKSQANRKLKELQGDARYTWNCDAEVSEFTGWEWE